LRYVTDREAYRKWLRIGVKRYKVPVFAYAITCNHVHLVVHVRDRDAVGRLMDLAAGATARHYNRRKRRSGAFWEGRYHATAVQSGQHLWRCLRYIDLNMVRAGKVSHPRAWRWCGYDELTGRRQRYRILDTKALLERLDGMTSESFRESYGAGIEERIRAGRAAREASWTEGLAVGSRRFVERVVREAGRNQVSYTQLPSARGEAWCVRDVPEIAYGEEIGSKTYC
jgi:putative transposase